MFFLSDDPRSWEAWWIRALVRRSEEGTEGATEYMKNN